MTPSSLATQVIDAVPLDMYKRILEPSCGDGAFLSAIVDRLDASCFSGDRVDETWELIGVEVDGRLAQSALATAVNRNDDTIEVKTRICNSDFFRAYLAGMCNDIHNDTIGFDHGSFDLVIGNPPFGGTFHRDIEDILDKRLGKRLGMKIKKETYAFFIVACVDLLRPGGRLTFICSDTLLTIPTMAGLRNFLMKRGKVKLTNIAEFSAETSYPMLVLDFIKNEDSHRVVRNAKVIDRKAILATPNLSWGVDVETAHFFDGPLLGDRFIATSGMTTGNNALFVRRVRPGQQIQEPFAFEFYQAPVTLKHELERARLGRLSVRREAALKAAEMAGENRASSARCTSRQSRGRRTARFAICTVQQGKRANCVFRSDALYLLARRRRCRVDIQADEQLVSARCRRTTFFWTKGPYLATCGNTVCTPLLAGRIYSR